MAKKRAHKVVSKEINSGNLVRVTDPVGRNPHDEIDFATLSGAQQALLVGHNRNRCGQS